MTVARAYRELARLSREGWFVSVLPGIGGEIMVLAAMGDREVRYQGVTVADVASDVIVECRRWRPLAA